MGSGATIGIAQYARRRIADRARIDPVLIAQHIFDLKIVVMSATLETGLLHDYLKPVEILESPGRMFPVSLEYLPKPSDAPAWELAAEFKEGDSA